MIIIHIFVTASHNSHKTYYMSLFIMSYENLLFVFFQKDEVIITVPHTEIIYYNHYNYYTIDM